MNRTASTKPEFSKHSKRPSTYRRCQAAQTPRLARWPHQSIQALIRLCACGPEAGTKTDT